MELKFIEDFNFLIKKFFLTKSQKLVSERNFDVDKISSTGRPVFLSNKSARAGLYCKTQVSCIQGLYCQLTVILYFILAEKLFL